MLFGNGAPSDVYVLVAPVWFGYTGSSDVSPVLLQRSQVNSRSGQ